MSSEFARTWGPRIVVGIGLLIVLGIFGPMVLATIQTGIQIALAAIGLGVILAFTPTLTLIVRNLAWKARKEVIAAMPIETLELGLQKIDQRIADIGKRVGEGKAAYTRMEQQVEGAKNVLTAEKYELQKRKLVRFQQLLDRQDEARKKAKAVRAVVAQSVEAAKVELSLGQGFASAASALSAGQPGGGTDDMNVAFESINKTLTEAQVALEIALEDHEDNVQQVDVREVERPQAQASLPPAQEVMPDMKSQQGVFVRKQPK